MKTSCLWGVAVIGLGLILGLLFLAVDIGVCSTQARASETCGAVGTKDCQLSDPGYYRPDPDDGGTTANPPNNGTEANPPNNGTTSNN